MNNYIPIEDAVDRLRTDFDWSHSFVRECYFVTVRNFREYADDSGGHFLGDTDGPRNARLIVASAGNSAETGVEFLFFNVKVFSIQSFDELHFEYSRDPHSGHSVRFADFSSNRECWVNAETVLVRFLGKSYLGVDLFLGFEFPTDQACEAEIIEGCWRQCGNCKDAWEENPRVVFSRCPGCGEVTKLKN